MDLKTKWQGPDQDHFLTQVYLQRQRKSTAGQFQSLCLKSFFWKGFVLKLHRLCLSDISLIIWHDFLLCQVSCHHHQEQQLSMATTSAQTSTVCAVTWDCVRNTTSCLTCSPSMNIFTSLLAWVDCIPGQLCVVDPCSEIPEAFKLPGDLAR